MNCGQDRNLAMSRVMAVAIQRFKLDEYLKYDDGADGRYELVDGG